MAQLTQLSCPVLGASACLHANRAGLSLSEMLENFVPAQLKAHNLPADLVTPVHLKDALRNVHADRRIDHGILPPVAEKPNHRTELPIGRRPYHLLLLLTHTICPVFYGSDPYSHLMRSRAVSGSRAIFLGIT